jgi:hypothetical protein
MRLISASTPTPDCPDRLDQPSAAQLGSSPRPPALRCSFPIRFRIRRATSRIRPFRLAGRAAVFGSFAAITAEDDNQMHSRALLSHDHTSFARSGLDR